MDSRSGQRLCTAPVVACKARHDLGRVELHEWCSIIVQRTWRAARPSRTTTLAGSRGDL